MLLSASNDGTVRLWDMVTFEPRMVLSGHLGLVTGATFLSDARTLRKLLNGRHRATLGLVVGPSRWELPCATHPRSWALPS